MDGKRREYRDPGNAASMARLLHVASTEDAPWWREEELFPILQHQLDAPLSFDLGNRAHGKCGSDANQTPDQTFRDLLTAPQPSLQLLQRLKEFAKSSDTRARDPLPTPVALVLYYWAIVAARKRCSARISGMPDEDLRRGVLWITQQAWLDKPTREFFRAAMEVQT